MEASGLHRPTNVCISAHFVVILVGDAPRLPPERPLAWSTVSSQLLHKGRELSAVHLDGLREAGLHGGRVVKEQFILQRTNEHPCLDARLFM